uniref:Uncharacterized protein n=1 Tax=Oryza rufipogon TaxID=4529 RepID=A0A0E0PKR2_ORYRU
MPGSARARLGARTVRTELKRGGSKAGGLNRKPALFEEAVVDAAMEAKGKKRKREVEVSHPALERAVVPTNSALPIHRSALESGEDSSESSPKAVIEFVRRVSPSTVSRSIDWDLINEDKSSKVWLAGVVCLCHSFCLLTSISVDVRIAWSLDRFRATCVS